MIALAVDLLVTSMAVFGINASATFNFLGALVGASTYSSVYRRALPWRHTGDVSAQGHVPLLQAYLLFDMSLVEIKILIDF